MDDNTIYEDDSEDLKHGYSTAQVKARSVGSISYSIGHGYNHYRNVQDRVAVTTLDAGAGLPALVLHGHLEAADACEAYWTKLVEIGGVPALLGAIGALMAEAREDGAEEALAKVRAALGVCEP